MAHPSGHQPSSAATLSIAADAPAFRLLLARPRPDSATPASHDTEASTALLEDARAMELAEWVYFNVEEVWSGFNLVAEAVARGFRIEAPTKRLQRDLDAYADPGAHG